MNIGDEVVYNGDYGDILCGKITAIGSCKDSYDDIKLEDGVFMYKSKKLKKKHSIPPPFLLTCLVTQPATKSSLSSFRSRNTTTDAPDAPGGFVMARLITT